MASSIPHFYSDYQFSSDEFSEITSVMAQENYGVTFSSGSAVLPTIPGGAMLCNSNNIANPLLFDNNNSGFDVFTGESEAPFTVPASSFSDGLGVSDMTLPAATLLDYKMGFGGIAKIQNFSGGFRVPDVCEFGDDCCDFIPNFKPVSACPATGENWGIQCNGIPAIDQNNMKVGRYTVEERKDRIMRYLKKRNQRNFNKTIKYACRKTLADRRVRVRGRFARNNNELGDEDNEVKKNNHELHQEKESYSNSSDDVQIKNDDDEWLQEAMASLMYVPYIAG